MLFRSSAVIGMKVGEKKTVTLKPEEAYGQIDERNIIEVPKTNVPAGVKEGDLLSMNGFPVVVKEVGNDTVMVDGNHQLAGKTLIFEIEMVRIDKK